MHSFWATLYIDFSAMNTGGGGQKGIPAPPPHIFDWGGGAGAPQPPHTLPQLHIVSLCMFVRAYFIRVSIDWVDVFKWLSAVKKVFYVCLKRHKCEE